MNNAPYPFIRTGDRYVFISKGQRNITKVVEFTLVFGGMFNLAFGNLMPDGGMDDMAVSNNGDIIKVMATVIAIIVEFTEDRTGVRIFFAGSTSVRTAFYGRVLRDHFESFKKQFDITGHMMQAGEVIEEDFSPAEAYKYFGFTINRK